MNPEKIRAVRRMQQYIIDHAGEELSLEALARAAAFSPWHALRAFSELTGKTPMAYLRAVRLTEAARRLRDGRENILDIALRSGFDSNEGFSRAFVRAFGLTPSEYRKKAPPLPWFTPYLISIDEDSIDKEGAVIMSDRFIFTSEVQRPARKLILKRGVAAEEYFAYCEEVGCDVWGILESVKGALDESGGYWLTGAERLPGTSLYVQGVEMPAGYDGPVPEGFDIIDLPPCLYLCFHGEPFEEARFGEAVGELKCAIERFDPALFGYEWAPQDGPRFQYPPEGARGYMELLPVRRK